MAGTGDMLLAMQHMTALRTLVIDEIYMGTARQPAGIFRLTSLTKLCNRGNMDKLPEDISMLACLRCFELHNHNESLHFDLTNVSWGMSTLVSLRIHGGRGPAFVLGEDNFTSLHALKRLSLHDVGGSTMVLPEKLNMLSRLEKVSLHDLTVQQLPTFSNAQTHLRGIRLCGMLFLRKLPDNLHLLSGLLYLHVEHCPFIDRIPETCAQIKKLRYLCFDTTSISALPESIGSLQHLREIRITNCTIRHIPASLNQLSKLRSITFRLCAGGSRQGNDPEFWYKIAASICGMSSLEKLELVVDAHCSGGRDNLQHTIYDNGALYSAYKQNTCKTNNAMLGMACSLKAWPKANMTCLELDSGCSRPESRVNNLKNCFSDLCRQDWTYLHSLNDIQCCVYWSLQHQKSLAFLCSEHPRLGAACAFHARASNFNRIIIECLLDRHCCPQ